MTQNRFSESNELELEATRKLLDLTRERLASAIFTITELETLLEMSRQSSSESPDSSSSKSE
jgi:hypothetical protein